MVRRLSIGKNNHLTCYSLTVNPRHGHVCLLFLKCCCFWGGLIGGNSRMFLCSIKYLLWVLMRSASPRRFWWVPTTCFLWGIGENYSRIIIKYSLWKLYNYYNDWQIFSWKRHAVAHIQRLLNIYIEDIQMFGVNMTFISSSEVKKCIFHECRRHEWNIHFLTSRDEIKIIFTTNIWIFFLLYTSLSIEEMQILHLQGKVWYAVLSLGAMTFMFCFVWWR